MVRRASGRSGDLSALVRMAEQALGSDSYSFLLQIGQGVPSSPMQLVTNSTGATKIVLVILVVLSLISWGIIFAKWYELRRAA